jgi:hypothetical protein
MYTMRICLLLILSIAATGCYETHPDKDRPVGFVTEILRVEAVPNPVAVGDTLRLKCVIKDSLKAGFEYAWGIQGRYINTDTPNLTLQIDLAPGDYQFSVTVFGKDNRFFDPTKRFYITIVQ